MAFNSQAMTPEFFLSLGSGLLSGRTAPEQIANAGASVAGTLATQKEKAKTELQLKTTADWLADKDPQLSAMVRNGSITPIDAYKSYSEKGKSDFIAVDGMVFDKNTKQWMAPPSNLKAVKPTADYQDFQLRQADPSYDKFKSVPSQTDKFDAEQSLWKNWRTDADVKEYQGVRNGFEKIRASAVDPSGPKDLGIIFGYMKMLDPTSVVREGEQASVANSGGVPQQVLSLYNRVLTGEKLPEQVRNDILKAAEGLYTESAQNYESVNSQVKNMADRYGVDPQFITPAEKYAPLKIGEIVNSTDKNGNAVKIQKLSD